MWRLNASEEVDDDIFALACGPDLRVRSYSTSEVSDISGYLKTDIIRILFKRPWMEK